MALDEVGCIAIPAEQVLQLLMADTGENARVGDLVPVEMQDGQHGAIPLRVKELVRVPAGRAGARFRFTVTHHARHDQVGIVEGRAVGVEQRVAQLAALVNGPRCLRRDMTGNPVGPGELAEEPLDAVPVLPDMRVDLAVGALEIGVGHDPGAAVPGTHDVNHVQIVLGDQPVEVGVDEVEARRGTPVAQQTGLDVVNGQGSVEERVVLEIDLSHREIVRRAPIGVHLVELVGRDGCHGTLLHGAAAGRNRPGLGLMDDQRGV
jgi:hypothetical protein